MGTTRGHSRPKRRRGATVVEFAVVAPILFLLVFGIIEFGRYVMLHQIAITSTREGCRKAVLGSTTSDQQVETVVRNYLAAGGVQSSVAIDPAKVTVDVTPSFDFDPTDPNSERPEPGTPITVDVQMSFAETSWLPGDFFGLGIVNVTSSTTMKRE